MIVIPEYFTWASFFQVSITCALGIFAIATAVSAYYMAPLKGLWRLLMAFAGLMLVAPSWHSDLLGAVLTGPVILSQLSGQKRLSASA